MLLSSRRRSEHWGAIFPNRMILRGGSGESLNEVLRERSRSLAIAGSRAYNPAWQAWLDLRSLLVVSEATIIAAAERKDSRGSHARLDYRERAVECDELNVVIKKTPQQFCDVPTPGAWPFVWRHGRK